MKLLRIGVLVLFVIVSAVFGWMFIDEKLNADKTVPVITIESELLEVSLEADNEELLKGVSAYDEKDKDITDRIIVESVSNFIDDGVCKVTYAVCDNDNHVAKKTRKIKYKDYIYYFEEQSFGPLLGNYKGVYFYKKHINKTEPILMQFFVCSGDNISDHYDGTRYSSLVWNDGLGLNNNDFMILDY